MYFDLQSGRFLFILFFSGRGELIVVALYLYLLKMDVYIFPIYIIAHVL